MMIFTHSTFASPPQTVPHVDLNRYIGTWYEVAAIEQRFQKGCTCSQAEYTLHPDGYLRVVNSCIKDGKPKTVTGRAYIKDPQTNAKLEVGFFLPSLPWFRGDYWVIGLDPQYRYSVISNSDASTLWILSRTQQLDPDLLAEAMKIAKEQGVDLSQVQLSNRTHCQPPSLER